MNLPVLHQLKTSSKDDASLKPKMDKIFAIMSACKKYVSAYGVKKVLFWHAVNSCFFNFSLWILNNKIKNTYF